MRRVLLAGALVGSACAGYNIESSAECASLCATARACGFLPSALGWDEGGDPAAAEADCVRRCGNSPVSEPAVASILGCHAEAAEAPGIGWCADEADAEFADWEPCAQIGRCLTRAEPGNQLHGEVLITVQMTSFVDYDSVFVDAADAVPDDQQGVTALYPALYGIPGCARDGVCDMTAGGDPDCAGQPCRPQSCARALCGRAACKKIQCFDEDCTILAEDVSCDLALCRVAELSIGQTCVDLGAEQITVSIREIGRAPVVQVFHDARAEVNASCESSTLEIVGENYQIQPGPVAVTATVRGALPGQALIDAGLRTPEEVPDPAAATSYCLEFVGPPLVLRAGDNTLVVPIAGLPELVAAGVDVAAMECPD